MASTLKQITVLQAQRFSKWATGRERWPASTAPLKEAAKPPPSEATDAPAAVASSEPAPAPPPDPVETTAAASPE
eukprot:954459-Prymnesium_polylepis.1